MADEEGQTADFLAGGGETGALMRAKDWSPTALGPPERWPQSLKTAVGIALSSRYPMFVWWGNELTNLYNDAYRVVLGTKHPQALGRPAREAWAEIWEFVGPRAEAVFERGEATFDEGLLLLMERFGYREETYFTFSYSPIRTARGTVGGLFCAVTDETLRVIGERRLRLLREVAANSSERHTPEQVCQAAAACIGRFGRDLPFALIYLTEPGGKTARLAAQAGTDEATAAIAEAAIDLESNTATWPLASATGGEAPLVIEDLQARCRVLPKGEWERPPGKAAILPFAQQGQTGAAGFLIVGLNPYRPLDEEYAGFLSLLAGQIAAGVANARAYQEERQRAEALAELDRAKTTFFSNVSHEFRTPLTLMLGPLEEALVRLERDGQRDSLPLIETAHRNGLRLLKLVNSLLDFSRIEAGRAQANYEETDLGGFTAELAAGFRSAIDKAGLRLFIGAEPMPGPVFVDREMWEKIVLNLVSNAFKFTFHGEIDVAVGASPDRNHAMLTVRDTGTGIPARELPRIFERFHRIEGARGRSFEGSGIGLAMVQELVNLHGGTIRAESEPGHGSRFIVEIPLGSAHLPPERLRAARPVGRAGMRAQAYVEEALRWLPQPDGIDQETQSLSLADDLEAVPGAGTASGNVLVADDNADMRDYVSRLLAERGYRVEAVADGEAALAAAQARKPDLVLSDVMMPQLDGFGLLEALRGHATLRDVPVILLSARAGEEARVQGLDAGADDYLIKPFSARELLARVGANLQIARTRREAAEALRARTAELEAVLETVPVAVWFTRDAEASRMWGNRQAAALMRLDPGENPSLTAPAEARPRHFRFLRSGIEVAPTALPIQRAARGEEVRNEELEVRFDDGRSTTILVHATPLSGPGGIAGAVAAAADITMLKQAEAALRGLNDLLATRVADEIKEREQAEAALRQAQKMEALGQLTGGVAHDFNNLLQVIMANLDGLQRRVREVRDPRFSTELRRHAEGALRGAERAATLTQRLLAFSRRQPLDPKPTDVNRLVMGMSELLQRTLGPAIVVETADAAGLWRVAVDSHQLESAILNLAVNARDAMPEGGKLSVTMRNFTLSPGGAATAADLAPGDYVAIVVRDTGVGMSEAVVARAFDPFFTTKEAGRGTGLGLSQVYGFVKQSGGGVTIESAPGSGATITLYLPRLAGEAGPGVETREREVTKNRSAELVLVVEDDADVRVSTSEMLRELGYDVIIAEDGQAALRLLDEHAAVRLLFTDFGLPGRMNGRQLAEAVRVQRPDLPVLFTTGYAAEGLLDRDRLAPGIELLAKPFSFRDLADKLRDVLEGAGRVA